LGDTPGTKAPAASIEGSREVEISRRQTLRLLKKLIHASGEIE
jgi:hypothetical protein